MKNTLIKLIGIVLILQTLSFAKTPADFAAIVKNAVPFGLKLGESTCEEVREFFSLVVYKKRVNDDEYGNSRIELYCGNRPGYRNILTKVVFKSETSYKKMGLGEIDWKRDLERKLLEYDMHKDEYGKIALSKYRELYIRTHYMDPKVYEHDISMSSISYYIPYTEY